VWASAYGRLKRKITTSDELVRAVTTNPSGSAAAPQHDGNWCAPVRHQMDGRRVGPLVQSWRRAPART